MFKRLYQAGQKFAETKVQGLVRSETMSPAEKKEAVGMTGLGIGNLLENVGLGGMALLALAAVAIASGPAGFTVGALLSFGAMGTALAGVGVFGKGMKDKGNEICGDVIGQAKELRKGLAKAVWNDLRGKKPQDPAFAPDAKPVATEFSAAVTPASGEAPATASAAPQVSAPEIK